MEGRRPAGRRRRGDATCRRVVEAAARLFVEQGYAATTMQAIADAAGVHVQTLYLAFGTKAAVLAAAGAALVAGPDDPASHPRERAWARAIQAAADPAAKLRLYAGHVRDIAPRTIPLLDVLRSTARAEPDVAAFLDQMEQGRREGPANLLAPVAAGGAFQPGISLSRRGRRHHRRRQPGHVPDPRPARRLDVGRRRGLGGRDAVPAAPGPAQRG